MLLTCRLRVEQWVSGSFNERNQQGNQRPASRKADMDTSGRGNRHNLDMAATGAEAYVSVRAQARDDKGAAGGYRGSMDDAGSEHAGSVASGSHSAGGSEAIDAVTAASGMEDELVADWRCVKG